MAEAEKVQRYFDKNYIGTHRIRVEFALERGNTQLARPWSKYSEGKATPSTVEEGKEEGKEKGKKEKGGKADLSSLLTSILPADKAASLAKDPVFHDFLHVLGGGPRAKFWENDEGAMGGQEGERKEVREVLDEDSDEETFNNPSVERKRVEEEVKAQPDRPLTDEEYLRARKTTAFDEDETGEAKEAENVEEEGEEQEEEEEEEEEREEVASAVVDPTRLYLRNLPFTATESSLTPIFSPYGPLSSIHLPLTPSGQSKGYAFVSYHNASHAQAALTAMNGKIVLGRILHITPALPRPTPPPIEGGYKAKKEKGKKAGAGGEEEHPNALFIRGDTVMGAMADQLGVTKGDILDVNEASSLAVRMALAETHLIGETKQWLTEQGVNITALQRGRGGDSEEKGKGGKVQRSRTLLLVKNIPYDAEVSELRTLFSAHGGLKRVLMPPSKTMAMVEFEDEVGAKRGFKALAYRKYHHVPLYLEWAPIDTLSLTPSPPMPAAPATPLPSAVEGEGDGGVTLFVKNLNFSTTESSLLALFTPHATVRSVHIATKKNSTAAVKAGGTPTLSMGYGFIELAHTDDVRKVIQSMQGVVLDGHPLELKPSTRTPRAPPPTPLSSTRRVVVKNLPFEATAAEVKALMGSFGVVKRVRLPKKMEGGHRGFAFVDFTTRKEAEGAMAAVGHSHLYGRALVVEWSEEGEEGEVAGEGEEVGGKEASERRVKAQRVKVARQFEVSQTALPAHKRQRKDTTDADDPM